MVWYVVWLIYISLCCGVVLYIWYVVVLFGYVVLTLYVLLSRMLYGVVLACGVACLSCAGMWLCYYIYIGYVVLLLSLYLVCGVAIVSPLPHCDHLSGWAVTSPPNGQQPAGHTQTSCIHNTDTDRHGQASHRHHPTITQ